MTVDLPKGYVERGGDITQPKDCVSFTRTSSIPLFYICLNISKLSLLVSCMALVFTSVMEVDHYLGSALRR